MRVDGSVNNFIEQIHELLLLSKFVLSYPEKCGQRDGRAWEGREVLLFSGEVESSKS